MGFPTALSSGQKTTLRTTGYWQRTLIAFNPGEVVFQCEANEDITDAPFKAFAWTNTLDGAYTDVWQGMVVYISSTSDYLKDYKYRGRVRLAPSSTEFRIDLNATTLETGDLITVLRDADFFAVVREGDLMDGSISYHNLPPVTTGLPSVLVLYDSDNDGSVTWTPAQTGIAVADSATISGYAWAISGTGTSSVSNAAAQNPNFTFAAGYHYLVRLTTTDSNGVTNFQFVQVYAISRTFAAPVIIPAVAGSVSQDLSNGYTGSVTAYGGVENLPDRTQAVVFCVEHFGDYSSTPIVTNVLMFGRLRSESILTEGSAEAGQLQQVTYPIEGITSYMQRMRVPNDIVRAVSAPDEWGEMVNPTPFRRAVYFLANYTTLLNLHSFSAGDSLFVAWKEGGEPISIDGGYALDALTTILDRIKAAPNYAPDGEIRCEITASYVVDRSSLVTIMDFLLTDALSFNLDIDTSKNTAQVIGYGGLWNTVNNTFILFTAQSPSIVYGDSPETRELTRELLETDSTTGAAAAELAARTGNDYAFMNPKWLLTTVLRDSHRWLIATNYQRYTWDLAASTNTRGVPVTTDTKWQCQSVNITINADGTYEVNPQFAQETEFTDAQSVASLLPANLPQLNPVFPVLSDFPAFPDSPTWGYPTDTPADAELQPIDPYSAWMGYSPFSPDQAAAAAQKQGNPKCRTFQVNMRNSGTTNSPFLTVNTAAYTLKISGFGQIQSAVWQEVFDFTTGKHGWDAETGGGGGADYELGVGFKSIDSAGNDILAISIPFVSTTITSVKVYYSTSANAGVGQRRVLQPALGALYGALETGTGTFVTTITSTVTTTGLEIDVDNNGSTTGNNVVSRVVVTGTGTNPFTGTPAAELFADWFYTFQDSDDSAAELFEATAGGLLDGNKPAVLPDYNPNHVYTIPFTGTGNAIQAAFALASYTDVVNKVFTIEACRNP